MLLSLVVHLAETHAHLQSSSILFVSADCEPGNICTDCIPMYLKNHIVVIITNNIYAFSTLYV